MSNEDRAQDEEAFQWALINRPRQPAPTYAPGDKNYGPEFCASEACGEPLPDLRRAMGKHLCTECQSLSERRQGLRR